jgi:signal transduction histidine kinase
MLSAQKFFGRSYYKIRVIITFSIVTMLLVVIMSRMGYVFIRDLYLDQLDEQVSIITKMISSELDKKYLELLDIGLPTKLTGDYFHEEFRKNMESELHSEIFIFDEQFRVVVHSNTAKVEGETEPKLFLNQKEIYDLGLNEASTSLPFKGEDGNWYLWGFYRLSNKYWLAVRESAARLERIEEFAVLFWYVGIGGTLFTILVSLLVAKRITKPIDKLVSFSSEIGKGDFKTVAPEGMKGEFEILAKAMDAMKQNLAENHKEREKILAQIAHEIRNPLGGIELLANLARENLSNRSLSSVYSLPDSYGDAGLNGDLKNKEYLDRILKEVNGLKSLITSYLNYSRPVQIKPVWVSLPKLLSEVKDIFKKQLGEKGINLVIDSRINVIYFDEDHLRQILINLVINSIDSVPAGGTIRIISFYKDKQWVLSISDNGYGIKEEDLLYIFDPFFTTKKEGTGLGLAISRKLSIENKAKIAAQNNPDKGATFTILKEVVNEI